MSDSSGAQRWDPTSYDRNARFVSTYGRDILAVLMPRRGERVLDLGCGDGVLTAEIKAAGAEVVGIDASPEFIAAARARKLDVRLLDAADLSFEKEFDAVFSNAALHWMHPLESVLAGVRRSLRPGGRFVGEMGGFGNCAAILSAMRAVLAERGHRIAEPWHFPTVEGFAQSLVAARFRVDSLALTPRPTPLPTGMRAWLETFAQPVLAGTSPAERGPVLDRIVAALAPSLRGPGGEWTADYVRLNFHATVT